MGRNEKGQFAKGNIPFNKGRPIEEWMPKEMLKKSKKTRFKKGNVPQNARYKGYISCITHRRNGVITGYDWYININFKGDRYNHYNYRKFLWETFYGEEAPKGMVFVAKNGNSAEVPTIDNIEMITRAELLKRNNPRW